MTAPTMDLNDLIGRYRHAVARGEYLRTLRVLGLAKGSDADVDRAEDDEVRALAAITDAFDRVVSPSVLFAGLVLCERADTEGEPIDEERMEALVRDSGIAREERMEAACGDCCRCKHEFGITFPSTCLRYTEAGRHAIRVAREWQDESREVAP